METRDCKFCQKPATYAPLADMEDMGIKIYFCHPCQAEYLYWNRQGTLSKTPSSVSLYAHINAKTFRWTKMAGGHGQLWRVGKPGVPGVEMNRNMESVYYLEDCSILELNPQNIEAKIRSWLPFL